MYVLYSLCSLPVPPDHGRCDCGYLIRCLRVTFCRTKPVCATASKRSCRSISRRRRTTSRLCSAATGPSRPKPPQAMRAYRSLRF